jgi:hypothetical protein
MIDTEREDRGIIVKIIDLSAEKNGIDSSEMARRILQRGDSHPLSTEAAIFVRARELIKQNPHGKRRGV